eukprot:1291511-Pleurochrysis_carterae.AAC.1
MASEACLSRRAMLNHSRQARLDHPASEARAPTRSKTLPLTASKARSPTAGRLVHKRRARGSTTLVEQGLVTLGEQGSTTTARKL